ncbi:GNAT family N-acetyltransferase [Brevibacillus porteri]|uniref:GNAT family N-acetyltransferase n=1 Tax=Brevibacillus porteri TaxID=2126350 RepID=UPI00370BBA65
MQMQNQMIGFRRLSLEDMPNMHKWLTTDSEVKRTWGYAHQGTYEEVISEFVGNVSGEELTEPYLILYGDTPIGYIQTFKWADYPGYDQYVDLTDAASLDLFIGEEVYRNKGLGTVILSRFLREYVFADPHVARCIINPEVNNSAAIQLYEKLGFHIIGTFQDIPSEPGPVHFMSIEREN